MYITKIGESLQQVEAGGPQLVWGIDLDDQVVRLTGQSRDYSWESVPDAAVGEPVADLAVAADGTVAIKTKAGRVWMFAPDSFDYWPESDLVDWIALGIEMEQLSMGNGHKLIGLANGVPSYYVGAYTMRQLSLGEAPDNVAFESVKIGADGAMAAMLSVYNGTTTEYALMRVDPFETYFTEKQGHINGFSISNPKVHISKSPVFDIYSAGHMYYLDVNGKLARHVFGSLAESIDLQVVDIAENTAYFAFDGSSTQLKTTALTGQIVDIAAVGPGQLYLIVKSASGQLHTYRTLDVPVQS